MATRAEFRTRARREHRDLRAESSHTRRSSEVTVRGVMALGIRSPKTLARSPERRGEVRRRKRRHAEANDDV